MVSTHKSNSGNMALSGQPKLSGLPSLVIDPQTDECFLLKIPGELRNRIYNFALSEATHLTCRPSQGGIFIQLSRVGTDGNKAGEEKDEVQANQLQYVCKQLRLETKGYGLRLNDLFFTFSDKDQVPPGVQCVEFFLTLAPHWMQHLRTITVCHGQPSQPATNAERLLDFDSQHALLDICRCNPQLTVRWIYRQWFLQDTVCRFFFTGISITRVYRGIDLRPAFNLGSNTWNDTRSPWVLHKKKLSGVPNFKVFPANASTSCEEFEKLVHAAIEFCAWHRPSHENTEAEKTQMLSWYKNGV